MPKFVIEREIPGAGTLSERDLKALSQKSCRGGFPANSVSQVMNIIDPPTAK